MVHLTENKNRPIYATVYLIAFLILAVLVKLNSPLITSFDKGVQELLWPLVSPGMTKFVNFLTFLGGPMMSFIYCIIICVVVYFSHDIYNATWAFLTVVCCNLINWVVKNIMARPRPSDRFVAEHGFSFPSGHTFGTALFVLLLFYLYLPHLHSQAAKNIIHILGTLWIIVIALTRIYLHVHYPTDTIASVLLVGFLFESSLMLSNYYNSHKATKH